MGSSCRMSYGVMGLCLVLMMMMMMMMAGEVAAQAAPAPAVDCQTVVFTLTDCLTFVSGSVKTPPAACCSNLSSVIDNSPQCLCLLFNTTFTAPLGVNVTLAQQLPPACHLTTPPTSLCATLGVPVPAPVSSISPATPPSSASAPGSSMAPTAPASGPAMATPPAAATPMSSPPVPMMNTPTGSPMAQSNTSTTAPPSSAPSTTLRGAAISASLLFLACIILS